MIFPLLKTWLKPIFGSALSSAKTNTKHPSGFRTIGDGGGGSSGPGRRKPTQVTDNLSFTESEERIVGNIKMHNLEVYAGSGAPVDRQAKGIMVSSEFKIVEDDISQNGDRKPKVIEETW
jgi:hypothetical protein